MDGLNHVRCFIFIMNWSRIVNSLTRITRDPAVMGGKACIRGLRVTVTTVLGLLAVGRTHEEILKAYPYLEAEDIAQSLASWSAPARRSPPS